jgi:uncharacterized protein DUF6790
MPAIDILYLTYQVIVVVGAGLHWLLRARPRTPRRLAEMLLHWSLVVNVGVAGLMGCYAHTVRARQTAEEIGWAPGSPFQFEVAMANLAFGVLGIACIWLRGLWWWATAVGSGVFLFGAAIGHVQQTALTGNVAPGNAGVILYYDFLLPIVHLALLLATRRGGTPVR